MGVLGGGFLGGGFINGSSSGGGGSPSGPAGGIDVTGTYPNALDVVGLRGQPIAATAPASGQVLTFNGTNWTPADSGLPSQAGNASKVLTTNGSATSWTATLVDVALTGSATPVEIQSLLDVNITALGGLTGAFVDNISLSSSSGTADFSGTGQTTIASVSADVSISANSGITLATTTGAVSAPTRLAGDSSTAIATTAFVQNALCDGARFAAANICERDDFISSSTTSGDLVWSASSTGGGGAATGPSNSVVLAGAHGWRTLNPGTGATGRAAFSRSELVSGQAAFVQPWLAGTILIAYRVQIPVLPTVGVDSTVFSFSLGTGLLTSGDHFVNGIGLRYNRNVSANWILASRVAGADVATANTGIAPTAGAWQWLVLVISGATATAYVGATYAAAIASAAASITTVGAYTSMLSPLMKANNTASGGSARTVIIDTYALDFMLTTSR